MALTSDQRRRALELLERLDGEEVKKVLQTEWSFTYWLQTSLYDIYLKVAHNIRAAWQWFKRIF